MRFHTDVRELASAGSAKDDVPAMDHAQKAFWYDQCTLDSRYGVVVLQIRFLVRIPKYVNSKPIPYFLKPTRWERLELL